MHLIFERPKGRHRSNCNILALAWMPYYNETKFRQALFDYHQRQLINLTNSVPIPVSRDDNQLGQLARSRDVSRGDNGRSRNARDRSLQSNDVVQRNQDNNQAQQNHSIPSSSTFLNSRVSELHQRYLYLKDPKPIGLTNTCELTHKLTGSNIGDELDQKYGKLANFGWLAIGNVGKIVGVSLTSLISPPDEKLRHGGDQDKDLMTFSEIGKGLDEQGGEVAQDTSTYKQNITISLKDRPDRSGVRQNYNLRGHMDEIILVKWNDLYQKLATVDSKGNVLIWCKVNEKFTIQTPFYNRTKSVADFKWSNDGKTALICYTDSFILVGSSSGQRHWHSMLNLDEYHITCASWTPNDEQLLLGVSNGNIVVIDLPSSELTELVVNQTNIRTMCWSTCDINLSSLTRLSTTASTSTILTGSNSYSRRSNVVNHRRLSRDCSVFSRYRYLSQGPGEAGQPISKPIESMVGLDCNNSPSDNISKDQSNTLAIDFADSTIKLYNGGLDDLDPKTIQVNQESYIMQWSSSGKILGVAGFNIHTTAPSVGYLRCRYSNAIKFYNQQGQLVYKYILKYTRYPITAFTWAHNDERIFIATGPRLHCAKVFAGVSPLSLMAMSCVQKYTKQPDKAEIIENILKGNYGLNIFKWQSYNCPIDIHKEAQRSKNTLELLSSTLMDAGLDTEKPRLCYNPNVYQHRLPLKLCNRIDNLFSKTIRQPFEETWTLSDVVWHVPRDEKRYYCTLICYTCEREIGSGYQCRSESISNRTPHNQNSDQNKIFVLYIECEGSLIPILKARRIGFLKPEFVIFDPEDNQSRLASQYKVSDVSQQQQIWGRTKLKQPPMACQLPSDMGPTTMASCPTTNGYYGDVGSFMDNCNALHNYSEPRVSSSSIGHQSLNSDIENYYNFECDTDNRRNQLKFADLMNNRSHHQEPLSLPLTSDQYLLYMMNIKSDYSQYNRSQKYRIGNQQNASNELINLDSENLKRAINRYKSRGLQGTYDNLPENKELVRIKSNIWGTKFKVFNVGNRVIRQRSLLSSVVYKASILHLQPRQIFMNVKDMSNYCCLCSKHHHTTVVTNRIQEQKKAITKHGKGNDISLLDVPNCELSTALHSSPAVQKRSRSRTRTSKKERSSNDTNKVLIPVGDSIRIVPKLEKNQHFRFAGQLLLDDQQPSTSKGIRGGSKHDSNSAVKTRMQLNGDNRLRNASASSITYHQYPSSERYSNRNSSCNSSTLRANKYEQEDENDDVLTLSLGHGDELEIGMSSTSESNSVSNKGNETDTLNEFLASNKTLKSIQTITKMIVNLSSKADETSDMKPFESASNLVESEGVADDKTCAVSSHFVPPETPVHRPRKRVPSARFSSDIESDLPKTQSATNTPLKLSKQSSRRSRRKDSNVSYGADSQLPPPPPSVPFGRRLSSSAKRFFDGSLRSLYGAGYSTSSDAEPEEYEPLVTGRTSRTLVGGKPANRLIKSNTTGQYSQPSSPLKSLRGRQPANEQLSNLKAQLLQRLRGGGSRSDAETSNASAQSQLNRSAFSESERFLSSVGKNSGTGHGQQTIDSSNSSLSWSMSDFSDSDFDGDGGDNSALPSKSALSYATPLRGQLAKERNHLSAKGTKSTTGREHDKQQQTGGNGRHRHKRSAGRRSRRKSICPNANCCCAREFKLNNRPPVWNELSQVYQLDFGGRVTQESAKNLQIDFEGNLVLQFGRIDRCTYTLDYRHPFNAVQAMAIALASLTQRLK